MYSDLIGSGLTTRLPCRTRARSDVALRRVASASPGRASWVPHERPRRRESERGISWWLPGWPVAGDLVKDDI